MKPFKSKTIILPWVISGLFFTQSCATQKTVKQPAQVSAIITEKNIAYTPDEQVVHLGQPIQIINNDPFDHKSRVTRQLADGKPGAIVLNDHLDKPGSSVTFKINTPGIYEIRCMLHDGMTASIKVES